MKSGACRRRLLCALLFLVCIGMCLLCYMVRDYSFKIIYVNREMEKGHFYNGKPTNRSQVRHYKSLLEEKQYSLSTVVYVTEKEQDAVTNTRNSIFPEEKVTEEKVKAVDYQHKHREHYGKLLSGQNHRHGALNEEHPTSEDKHPMHKPDLYVFSLSYMDQMSWASTRWRSLQCWASQLSRRYSVHVIEPFVTDGSHLGVPTPVNQSLHKVLKFSDIFDIGLWQKGASKGSLPFNIVSWDAFMSSGARNAVTVQIVYPYHYHCTENGQTDKICNNNRMQTLFSEHLALKGFTLMKSICINFRKLDILTLEQFNAMIFDSIPGDLPITIMFDEWRGLAERSCFVRVSSKLCRSVYEQSFVNATLNLMRPSLKVDNAARKYIHRYIHQHVSNRLGYAAIMIRWEKILNYDFYYNKSQHYSGSRCVKRILKYLKDELFKKRHIQAYFLTSDIGKYGSSAFTLYNSTRTSTSVLTKYTQTLLRILHENDSLRLSEYEQRFEKISGTTSPAFISQLQKDIAARARCLLLVGWGSFLTNTLDTFKSMHKGQLCYKQIMLC